MQRITAEILLVQGAGPAASAHLRTESGSEPIRVPAARIAKDTGYDVDQLAGRCVVALVDEHGELAGFEPA